MENQYAYIFIMKKTFKRFNNIHGFRNFFLFTPSAEAKFGTILITLEHYTGALKVNGSENVAWLVARTIMLFFFKMN